MLCSVQTGWSISLHPRSTAQSAQRTTQTLWCSGPAGADSSPAACHGWWSAELFGHALPSLKLLDCDSRSNKSQIVGVYGSRSHFCFRFLKYIFMQILPYKERCVFKFADGPLRTDPGYPIRAEEVLFPGMFGDVAKLWNLSEEYQKKLKPHLFTWEAPAQVSQRPFLLKTRHRPGCAWKLSCR